MPRMNDGSTERQRVNGMNTSPASTTRTSTAK
jgi:hypothetical protein